MPRRFSNGAAIVEVAPITPAAAPALISTALASNTTAEAVSTSSDVTQHAIRKRSSSGIRSAAKKGTNIIRSTAVDAAGACGVPSAAKQSGGEACDPAFSGVGVTREMVDEAVARGTAFEAR